MTCPLSSAGTASRGGCRWPDDKKGKPLIHDDQGVKDSRRREDKHRRDKRPRPGPLTGPLDGALAEGTIEPDPGTPSQTLRE